MEYKDKNPKKIKEGEFPGTIKEYPWERNLKKKWEKAIAERDGEKYVLTSLSLGYDPEDIPDLAQEGYAQMALDTKKSMDTGGLEEISLELDKELKEQLEFKAILENYDYKTLYNKMQKEKFNEIFSRLKKAEYQGLDGEGMEDWKKMDEIQRWNYLSKVRKHVSSL